MRIMKKITLLLLIIAVSLSSTGCWGKKELGEISIATITGIDIEPNGEIKLTVLTREPIGSAETQALRSATLIRASTGRSIMDARKNLLKTQGKRPIWSHNRAIIIGKDVTKEGLDRFIDFFARNREFRLDTSIIIAEGRADDILQQPSGVQASLADDLQAMIENSKVWSEDYILSLKDFLIQLIDRRLPTVTSTIGVYKSPQQRISTNRESFRTMEVESNAANQLIFMGSTVLENGRYSGELNYEEAKGLLWSTSDVKEGILVFSNTTKKGNTSIEPVKSNPKLVLNTNEEKISFTIEIEASGYLSEITEDIDVGDEEVQKMIEKNAAKAIISEMKAAVNKAQKEHKVDIFGFGNTLYKEYPEIWRKVEDDWDEIFPDIEIMYDVKFKLRRIGLMHNATSIE